MANLILTWEEINSWGGTIYNSDVKMCPTRAQIEAVGLSVPYSCSGDLLVYNVSKATYGPVTVSIAKVEDIPAGGGSINNATIEYSLTKTVYNYLEGTSSSTITSGGIVSFNTVTASNLEYTETSRQEIGTLTATVTLNGLSGSASTTVYLQANTYDEYIEATRILPGRTSGAIFIDKNNNMSFDEGEPMWNILGAYIGYHLEATKHRIYTSGSVLVELDRLIDEPTWNVTYSGDVPVYLKIGDYVNQPYFAWVYTWKEDESFEEYRNRVGLINVGDSISVKYTLTATYEGQVYTFDRECTQSREV